MSAIGGAYVSVKYGHSKIRKEGSIVLTSGIAGQRPRERMDLRSQRDRSDGILYSGIGDRFGADSRQPGVAGGSPNRALEFFTGTGT
jgi:hypothetical protein